MMAIAPLFFPLIFFCFFSSALSASVITRLPGFRGPLPFYLETGYVEVDRENGGELFYYFIQSEGKPADDPLLLWLTGGPRCSAFSGLVFEIGPLKFVTAEYNGSLPSLVYHPYSWAKVANVIFVDSPTGSGFSYSRKNEGYDANDTSWSEQAYKFLIQWLVEHPQFISNPLYIAGDSYAGKIVPIVAKRVMDDIDEGKESLFNLQGYLIGNPVTGGKVDKNSQLPYAHGMGIISDDLFEMTQRCCVGQDYRTPTNSQCVKYLDTYDNFYSEINQGHILEMACAPDNERNHLQHRMCVTSDKRNSKQNLHFLQPPPLPDLSCRTYAYVLSYYWANSKTVRKALAIKQGTIKEWVRCNFTLPYTTGFGSNIDYHLSLLQRGYRALVYSGDHDLVIPFLGTRQWIKSLNSSIVDNWRSWFVDGQVAGYTMAYSNNLTFATVKGAGHTAPEYKPKECQAMISRWIANAPL
ncbi:serine carboxypeptidase-like 18 isoform X1 [Zingiber officinale]|uniref:serine carboxypeptidase-like 18 isoform X1 n=1 Tax=Zingiber officinale TaxID=94328 RepID=UPI001C4D2C81|nr:serine carboxypeptidase-like 18 isoform X1 [Zingiber officinale]